MYMAYNHIYDIYHNLFCGDIMRICIVCSNEFVNICREVCCSKKCKLINGYIKNEKGCFIYKKSASGSYGKIRWKMKWYSAHRVAFEEFNGEIPEGKWVCHKCDTPKCVNPEHLFLGSASDNRKDCLSKKRALTGESHHFSKFTNDQVSEMKILRKEGFSYQRLMRIFNCSMLHLQKLFKEIYRKE